MYSGNTERKKTSLWKLKKKCSTSEEFKDITDTYVYILYKHIHDHIDT